MCTEREVLNRFKSGKMIECQLLYKYAPPMGSSPTSSIPEVHFPDSQTRGTAGAGAAAGVAAGVVAMMI